MRPPSPTVTLSPTSILLALSSSVRPDRRRRWPTIHFELDGGVWTTWVDDGTLRVSIGEREWRSWWSVPTRGPSTAFSTTQTRSARRYPMAGSWSKATATSFGGSSAPPSPSADRRPALRSPRPNRQGSVQPPDPRQWTTRTPVAGLDGAPPMAGSHRTAPAAFGSARLPAIAEASASRLADADIGYLAGEDERR